MRLRALTTLFTLVVVIFTAAPVRAQVGAVGREAFTVDFTTRIDADPQAAWDALLDVGSWWHPDHTFWGDASAMEIDPRPGGCFCEQGPGGAGAVHLMVLNVAPHETLRLGGALGPLQEHALSGAMTIRLEAADSGTTVRLIYNVGGHVSGGLEGWAEPVAGVLVEAMQRLRAFVETGSPEPDA